MALLAASGSMPLLAEPAPALPATLLGGEVAVDADETLQFVECRSGRSYAIGPGPEAERLAQEYRRYRPGNSGALYVTFDGSLHPYTRSSAAVRSASASVVVDRYFGAWPNQSCERSRADAALANTYWRIVQLLGAPISADEGRREPHLLLRQLGSESSFAATVGCNQFKGSWQHSAQTIAFERGTTTRMACPVPLAQLEGQLQSLLDTATRWRGTGLTLLLEDAQGSTLALLEAVYF